MFYYIELFYINNLNHRFNICIKSHIKHVFYRQIVNYYQYMPQFILGNTTRCTAVYINHLLELIDAVLTFRLQPDSLDVRDSQSCENAAWT